MTALRMSNAQLLEQLYNSAARLRGEEASLLSYLDEVDQRKLYAEKGYSSMFTFCVEALNFSEASTCRRLAVARAGRIYPELYEHLRSGSFNIRALALLVPHLSLEGAPALLAQAKGLKTRELDKLIAALAPKPDVSDALRRAPAKVPVVAPSATAIVFDLPVATSSAAANVFDSPVPSDRTAQASKFKDQVRPSAAERYHVRFSASEDLAQKIKHAKDLLAHKYPEGRLEDLMSEALDLLIKKHDIMQKTERPAKQEARQRPSSRTFPAAAKREIIRDQGRSCAFVSAEGKRCGETRGLQYDHVQPWALNGESSAENGQLLCGVHNRWRAEQTFEFKLCR